MTSSIIKLGFSEATQTRRSIRTLLPRTTVPDTTIIKVAEAAILNVPSAFNSQTTRLTILFGEDHKQLWSITGEALLARIGHDRWNGGFKEKIANFSNAYGTILFWDDESTVIESKQNIPDIYRDKMDEWVHQSNGMHQYYLWTALEAMGLGANVQHYNPLIDAAVQKTWSINPSWKLRAQMVFGTPTENAAIGEKVQKLGIEERLNIFGGDGKL